jgi:hypothetical protein
MKFDIHGQQYFGYHAFQEINLFIFKNDCLKQRPHYELIATQFLCPIIVTSHYIFNVSVPTPLSLFTAKGMSTDI